MKRVIVSPQSTEIRMQNCESQITDMRETLIIHHSEIYNASSKLCSLPWSLMHFLSWVTFAQELHKPTSMFTIRFGGGLEPGGIKLMANA